MTLFDVISLLGGLALFLYGMSMLGEGLENASGGKLELVLEKLTNNVVLAVLLGAMTTAAIQSSSATTVIVVGLVNAKVLTLRRAIGVIMGANIGTTVTGQMLRLADISSDSLLLMFLKPTTLAPFAAIIGIALYMGSKRTQTKNIGVILLGFGILFTGMFGMERAVYPLRNMPEVTSLFATLTHPLFGVPLGAVVTAIIQSSSASVGILQALSSTGQITYAAAFPIIMGQNIGTCVTPLLASIGASKNAKRAAAVHLSFNVIGTIIFLIGTYAYQHIVGFDFWNDPIGRGGIADFHTLFNIGCTLIFLPFVGLLEKLACAIVRDGKPDAKAEREVLLEERLLASPALALEQGRRAMSRMSEMTRLMLRLSVNLFDNFHFKRVERIRETQAYVDKMLVKLEDYILKLSHRALSTGDSLHSSELLNMTIELRHTMSDIISVMEYAIEMYEKRQSFSPSAQVELMHIARAVGESLRLTSRALAPGDKDRFASIEALNTIVGQVTELLKDRHIDRLRQGACSIDASFVFVGVLALLRKVADHCANIAVMQQVMLHGNDKKSRRLVMQAIQRGTVEGYPEKLAEYQVKYQNGLVSTLPTDQGNAITQVDVW